MKRITRGVAAAAIMITATTGLTGCGTASPEPDREAIRYDQPPFQGRSFRKCVTPGGYDMAAPWSGADYYDYPVGLRTYTFDGDGKKSDAPAFSANTSEGVEMRITGVVAFRLSDSCDALRSFHENIGIKHAAYLNEDGNGWKTMLDTYLKPSIQRAVNDATQSRSWKELYNDPKVKAEWEKDVKQRLPQYMSQSMSGTYFEDFSPTIQKPDIPDKLAAALNDTQIAIQANTAQKERNKQIDSELVAIRKLVAVLGPDGYNTYQAVKDGKIQVVTIPQGSSVVVQPGAGK